MQKIKDIQNLSEKEINNGANYYNVNSGKAVINNEKYPMFIAKIINKVIGNEMPFMLTVGKPGTGKTYACALLGYILTHEIGFFSGDYKPQTNIHYDNIPFLESVIDNRNSCLHKPEINTTLHALDYNDKGNREFEKMLNLSRIFGNFITGDAQKLYRCDRAVRENHTFRLVAVGGENDYWFDVYYIDRPEDSEKKKVEKYFLQRWKPEKPPQEFVDFIDEKDENWKTDALKDGVKELKKEQEENDGDNLQLV